MEKVLKEEKVIHKNRSFSLKLSKKDEGFYVDATDDETGKDVGVCHRCRHEVCNELIAREGAKNPIEEIVEAQKKTIIMWVDKGLI